MLVKKLLLFIIYYYYYQLLAFIELMKSINLGKSNIKTFVIY
jgi:hypothetical protein